VIGEANFKTDATWKVSLANPNIAIATDDQGAKHKGTWTTVYDEGVEVTSLSFKEIHEACEAWRFFLVLFIIFISIICPACLCVAPASLTDFFCTGGCEG